MHEKDLKSTNDAEAKGTGAAEKVLTGYVLVYKTDPANGLRSLVRVPESELERDKSLVPFVQERIASETKAATDGDKRPPAKKQRTSSKSTKTIRALRLQDTMKVVVREGKISKDSRAVIDDAHGNLDILSPFVLAHADRDLKRERLWKDALEEIPFSEAFPNTIRKGSGPSPELPRDAACLQDDDITADDRLAPGQTQELPRLSTSSLYELMRPPPRSILFQVARKLESRFLDGQLPTKEPLFLACLLLAREIETAERFTLFMESDLGRRFPDYAYIDYCVDLIFLVPLLERAMEEFFRGNRAIENALGAKRRDPAALNIWRRLERAWASLTTKQRNALEKLYCDEEAKTYEEAAKDFGISISSLQDRVQSGRKKIRAAFPEFKKLKPSPRIASQQCDLRFNGLWRESNAKKVHPLKAYDLATGRQYLIPAVSKIRKRELAPGEIARIKADIYEKTPIPNILDADYFLGMRPSCFALKRESGEGESED